MKIPPMPDVLIKHLRSQVAPSAAAGAGRPRNSVLRFLPEADWQRIMPLLRHSMLEPGQMLQRAHTPIERIYFPNAGLVSLLTEVAKSTVETIAIGRNGFIGSLSDIVAGEAIASAEVQIAGNALWLSVDDIRAEFEHGEAFSRVLLLNDAMLLSDTSRAVLCNRLHSVEERLSRWLLSARDYTDSETIAVTHENIARLLGTRRSGITVALGVFAAANLIDTSRGHVVILDSSGLEKRACPCYQAPAGA
ncbi:MAG TPA: Crp/Fnr family transcriptional regulator [Abditibacteriaceae bacterium]